MTMAKNYFNRYVWLLSTIRMRGPITFEELSKEWANCSLNEARESYLPKRTFHNHKEAIEDTFGIEIKYSQTEKGYYLDTSDDPAAEYKQWLLDCIGLNNALNECSSIRDKVLLEEVPSNKKWLSFIVDAIAGKRCFRMTYQSFWMEEPSTFDVHPYCLKLFKQRWYLLARSEKFERPRVYSLDRIQEIVALKKKLRIPANFDAHKYFSNFFGVIVGDTQKLEVIKIKVDADQVKYFESLPLHPTQTIDEKETKKCKDGSKIFAYNLVPTFDFEQELLRHGSSIEVLAPASLRKSIKNEVTATLKRYK